MARNVVEIAAMEFVSRTRSCLRHYEGISERMNIFDGMSESLGQLQRELALDSGNQSAGTIMFSGGTYPAVIGVFTVQQILKTGGYMASLVGQLTVNKKDLPAGTIFHSGNAIEATAPLCLTRNCQVVMVEDCMSFWIITVEDVSQNAA